MRSKAILLGAAAAVVVASGVAAVTTATPGGDREEAGAAVVTLAVEGRANATPWVSADGNTVAVAWGATVAGKADVYAAVSTDGGTTFAAPVRVNGEPGTARLGGELPPRVALIRTSAGQPSMAVLWTSRGAATAVRLARSTDGGRTFGRAETLQSAGAAGDRGWAALAVDGQGTAHAVWLDHRGLAATAASHHKSPAHDGMAMAQKSALRYASSPSGGPATADKALAQSVCYCCKTALIAGEGGTLFAAWRHVYPGNLRDIAFTVSRDRGRTFAAPVRISEDDWAIDGCPDDGPSLAVDAAGTVHAIWPTVVKGAAGPEGALFYATSGDGRTFSPRVRVPTLGTGKPSHPQVVAMPGGRVVVAWDEVENGRRAAMLREVRQGGSVEFGNPIRLSEDAATYPVLAAVDGGLLAVWATGGPASTIRVARVPLP